MDSNAGKQYDVITFGDMCVDLIVSGEDVTPRFGQVEKLVNDYTLEMGGSCCLFACQAARLGLRVGILGRIGDDDFGRLALHRLGECGVDTQHVIVDPTLKTGLGIALCQACAQADAQAGAQASALASDRAILTYLGSLCALRPDDVSDTFLASARHLHHGSFFLQTGLRPHMPDVYARAKALGLSTSLDPNWDPDEHWNSTLLDVLALTDVFLPNAQEALHISRQPALEQAAAWLRDRGASLVAIKQGAEGASLYTGRTRLTYPVIPVTGGDSIGAGDSFDAGFLAGWLRDLPADRCLDIACRCGRSVASAVGGLAGQLTWEEL
jgi:sugar/nucleoside kinase (ribokinase family)